MSKVAGEKLRAFRVDPRSAETAAAGEFAKSGVQSFTTPAGWEGALSVLEAAGK